MVGSLMQYFEKSLSLAADVFDLEVLLMQDLEETQLRMDPVTVFPHRCQMK
jgi:hypothetical protein